LDEEVERELHDLTYIIRMCFNVDRSFQVYSTEHDTGIDRCRAQGEGDFLPRMQPNSGSPYHVFKRALPDHTLLFPIRYGCVVPYPRRPK
jgi:hypothetical protein